jgi:hypothetical protein
MVDGNKITNSLLICTQKRLKVHIIIKRFSVLGVLLTISCLSSQMAVAARPCPPILDGSIGKICPAATWEQRSTALGVFYANNFDYDNRTQYIDDANQTSYEETTDFKPKLDLETTITLSGKGASRHNWFVSEGANEAGPSWDFSFDGIGAQTTNTKKEEFYMQYSLYVDQGWVDFNYTGGSIKTLILYNPGVPPFAHGELVMLRHGKSPFPSSFYVTNTAISPTLVWSTPSFVNGDDTYYSFYDGGTQSANGETDQTDINLFEQRYGPRRRNAANGARIPGIPKFEGDKWYTFGIYVNVTAGNSVFKVWFSEHGQSPELLLGYMNTGITSNNSTYRGGHLISRAENAFNDPDSWITSDTFIAFDELIVSDNEILWPTGDSLPYPGTITPANWPPAGSRTRH